MTQLDKINELIEKVLLHDETMTPGPWLPEDLGPCDGIQIKAATLGRCVSDDCGAVESPNDQIGICYLRTAAPVLAAMLRRAIDGLTCQTVIGAPCSSRTPDSSEWCRPCCFRAEIEAMASGSVKNDPTR